MTERMCSTADPETLEPHMGEVNTASGNAHWILFKIIMQKNEGITTCIGGINIID